MLYYLLSSFLTFLLTSRLRHLPTYARINLIYSHLHPPLSSNWWKRIKTPYLRQTLTLIHAHIWTHVNTAELPREREGGHPLGNFLRSSAKRLTSWTCANEHEIIMNVARKCRWGMWNQKMAGPCIRWNTGVMYRNQLLYHSSLFLYQQYPANFERWHVANVSIGDVNTATITGTCAIMSKPLNRIL